VGCHDARLFDWNARSSNDERKVNILLKTAFFAWIEAMLRDMVAVVGGVYDVCIVEDAISVE